MPLSSAHSPFSHASPASSSRDSDINVYASSISSTETSPMPDIRRPDSPRPMNDAQSRAKVRLRQLVIWSDAAEEARDTAPVEAYISTPEASPTSASTTPLQHAHDNVPRRNSNTLHSFTNKLRHLQQHDKACPVEFPTVPSSPTASSSSEEDDDDDEYDHENCKHNDLDEIIKRKQQQQLQHSMGRLNKLEQSIAYKRQSQILDRTQPCAWYNNITESHSSAGLMRRKSFFNGRKPAELSSPSLSLSRNQSLHRNCYSTGYSTTVNNSSQSIYDGFGSRQHQSFRRAARRPQSFHRYARIVPDCSLQGREKASFRTHQQQQHDMDEFDDLIDGLHATKVTETPLQPQA